MAVEGIWLRPGKLIDPGAGPGDPRVDRATQPARLRGVGNPFLHMRGTPMKTSYLKACSPSSLGRRESKSASIHMA